MAWCQTGDKSFSEPMLTQFTDTYICRTRGDELTYSLLVMGYHVAVLKIRTICHTRVLWKLALSCKRVLFTRLARPEKFTRYCLTQWISNPGGGTRPENWWGCAAGRWKLDPKRSRKKLNLGPKRSIFVKIGSFCTPKDSFAVGGWEKYPKKIVLDPAKVKKGGQNRGTYVSPIT